MPSADGIAWLIVTKIQKYRPRLSDRIMLRLSTSENVDGLWVGTSDDNPKRVLCLLREALSLIKLHDPLRYSRLTRDLERVWAQNPSHHAIAGFEYRLGACALNAQFVLAEATTLERLASTIVHEATHARLWNRGIRYDEAIRPRVEAVCVRRELAFAAKLPNGTQLLETTEQALAWCNGDNLSNKAFERRREQQDVDELHRLGVPNWLVRAIVALAHVIWALRRSFRSVARRAAPRATH